MVAFATVELSNKKSASASRGEGTGRGTFGAEIQKIIDNAVKYMDNRFKNLRGKASL